MNRVEGWHVNIPSLSSASVQCSTGQHLLCVCVCVCVHWCLRGGQGCCVKSTKAEGQPNSWLTSLAYTTPHESPSLLQQMVTVCLHLHDNGHKAQRTTLVPFVSVGCSCDEFWRLRAAHRSLLHWLAVRADHTWQYRWVALLLMQSYIS